MPHLKSRQLYLFYLLLFLVPSNLAKHLLLPSAYVSGILVDYLIPSLYLTDILIIFLLFSSFTQKLRETRQTGNKTYTCSSRSPSVVFLLLLLPSLIFAASILPAVYKWLKFLEMILLVLWLKQNLNLKKHLTPIINCLTLATLFQSLLALAQWFKQASVFGYWFLGEQPYHAATPGIDKITWFNGALKIPPLGTTPHPNLLAGFLVACLPLILYQFLKSKKLAYLVSFVFGLMTLFLTFSLSGWLAFLLIGLPATLLFQSKSKLRPIKFILIYLGLFLIIFSFANHLSFLAPQSSFSRRSQLAKMALTMIKDHPLTGVGLNNFTVVMENYGYIASTTRFLQPVHNIYLLILSETGLIGLIGFVILILTPLYQALKTKSFNLFLIPYLSLLFIGLFDHYPLTLQTGLLSLIFLAALSLPQRV